MTPDLTHTLLTADQVADLWGVEKHFVYRLCRTKALSHVRLAGQRIRIPKAAADAWLAANTIPASTDAEAV